MTVHRSGKELGIGKQLDVSVMLSCNCGLGMEARVWQKLTKAFSENKLARKVCEQYYYL